MLHNSYAEANLDLADEMVYLFLNPFDTSVASKLVTAMFNLKEIEGTLHFAMTKENEVEQYANKSVTRILLSPVASGNLDDDELNHYIESIINVCKVNRRLQFAFFINKAIGIDELFNNGLSIREIAFLKKISSKIANSFS